MWIRKIGLICAVLAMFSIAGGQWAVLQSVAWAQMIRAYSQRPGASLRVAFVQTFDGEHPCALCREIQVAKRTTREQPTAPQSSEAEKKSSALSSGETDNLTAVRVPARRVWHAFTPIVPSARTEPPPVPPPRWV